MLPFHLNIPETKWQSYYDHILVKIYGLSEKDFKIIGKTDEIRRIEFQQNPLIPLINSLPSTIIQSDTYIYFPFEDRYNQTKNLLDQTISDFKTPLGNFNLSSLEVIISEEEMPNLIKQLARDKIIQKFMPLSSTRYLITIENYLLIFKLVFSHLNIKLCLFDTHRYTFDIDDGYSGPGIRNLNIYWKKWADQKDISAPIFEPNYV